MQKDLTCELRPDFCFYGSGDNLQIFPSVNAAALMDTNFDVRNVLHNVDNTPSLCCSWCSRSHRWEIDGANRHTNIECATRGAPPKAAALASVTTWAVSSVTAHARQMGGFEGTPAMQDTNTKMLSTTQQFTTNAVEIVVHAHRARYNDSICAFDACRCVRSEKRP